MQPWRITSASAARSVRRRAVVPQATSCIHSSTSSHDVLRRPRIHVKKKPEEPAVPPSWKPFEIPNVLLDLDSWGNEYTRPYDADEAKAQRQKWAADPRHDAIRKRVVRFSRILAKLDESFDRVNEDAVWQHWRLMDQDIMVAALQNLGAPRPRESHDYSSFQRHVFYNNAVPESTYRDDKRLIGWLLHRRLTTRHDRFHPDRLASAIDASKSTSDLHRLISSLLDSNQRIPMKPFHANKIAAALSRLSTDPDHVKLLPVLNSFFLYCKQSGYTFTPALCDICMAISARALRLGALEMYLQHGVNNKYWDDSKPTEIEGVRLTLNTLEWHLGNFQTKSIDGGHVRDRPFSARHINDLANYANPRDVLSRLCALFKKIVESNPTDSALKTQHEKVVDMVKSLPAGASRAGGSSQTCRLRHDGELAKKSKLVETPARREHEPRTDWPVRLLDRPRKKGRRARVAVSVHCHCLDAGNTHVDGCQKAYCAWYPSTQTAREKDGRFRHLGDLLRLLFY